MVLRRADIRRIDLYDGMTPTQLADAAILVARAKVEREPAYSQFAARLRLQHHYTEILGPGVRLANAETAYRARFRSYLERGIAVGLLGSSGCP